MATTTTELDTPLAKALAAAGLGGYSQAFNDKGYTTWESLGDDKTAVATAVSGVVPANMPGVVNRIVGLWVQATTKPEKDPPKEPLPLLTDADLKPGTQLDLSGSSVTIDDVQFAIPTAMQTMPGVDYGPADWVGIAHRTQLLYGLDINSAFESTSDDSARASKAALSWSVPDNDGFAEPGKAHVTSAMSYTASLNNLVHNRIIDAKISVGLPFVSAAASASRNEKQASSQQTRLLHMTGEMRYDMAILRMRDCTVASPDFLAAIKAALAQPEAQQFESLKALFKEYGHMVPASVTLGGDLYFQYERTTTGSVDDNQVSTTVAAAVSAKYGGVAASADASFSDGSKASTTAQEIAENSTFTCVGGDITLASNPAQWASTVKDPKRWAVIARQGLVSVIDWLDAATKASVLNVWQAGLKQAWGGFTPPADYVLPDFDGEPFTIATSPAGRKLTPPYPIRPNHQLPASDRMALHVVAGQGVEGWIEAQEGTLLTDPKSHELLFELLYTGLTSQAQGKGLPLYCLVSKRSDGLYVAVPDAHDVGPIRFLKWSHAADGWSPSDNDPSKATTSWTLLPADASGFLGADFADTYLIQNYVTGRLLGPVKFHDRSPSATLPPEVADAPDFFVKCAGDPANLSDVVDITTTSILNYGWVCTKFDSDSRG